MRLTVVGAGLIGASIGRSARARGVADEVVAVEPDAAAASAAREVGAADRVVRELAAGVDGADLIVLAAPPGAIVRLLPAVASIRPAGAIVTDVGSVKGPIAAAAADLPWFVPGHPMAGSERHGAAASLADLFVGATWPLTPTERTDPAALERVTAFVAGLGARPQVMTPEAHDRAVAVTSHLPHAMAFALYAIARQRASAGDDALFALAAGGFHSATRVAASSPALWRDICMANRQETVSAARAFAQALGGIVGALERGDDIALLKCLEAGHRAD